MNKNISCENCQARRRKFGEKEYSCWLEFDVENDKPKCGDCPAPKTFGDFCRALSNIDYPKTVYYFP